MQRRIFEGPRLVEDVYDQWQEPVVGIMDRRAFSFVTGLLALLEYGYGPWWDSFEAGLQLDRYTRLQF